APQIKYNSSADNRRRQEYSFEDAQEVYGNMIPEDQKHSKKKRKRHPVLAIISVLLVLVIVATGSVSYYAYSTVKNLIGSITVDEPLKENAYISDSELYKDSEQINILLVGTDAREKDVNSRSDTMILLTLDYKNQQIKLTSFLRDSYVQIAREGLRSSKLNSAYFRGGIQMLIDTLELNFKVEIPYYAIVDFEIFENIIDKIGGIDVEVTAREAKYINSNDHMTKEIKKDFPEEISEGVNHFTGGQALWYSRIRYLDSDFMRTQRQRKVIQAIINKTMSQEPKEILALAQEIMPMVRTNIPSEDTLQFGINAIREKAYTFPIVQHSIPADKTWSNKTISGVGACLVLDFDKNIDLLHTFLKDRQLTDEETK
ncbi:MAG: LCP family protein, partial [Oscillospiraceae bacterium]|nr:LCP family protein [Oscillospiraceae bacterium]